MAVTVGLLIGGLTVFAGTSGVSAAVPKTIVSLTFDDGNDDQMAAEQVLRAHGLVGTFFITTSWIDQPTWLTRANLQTIAADGNEIGGHTVTHPDLTTISASAATAEICNGRTTLQSWGFTVTDLAWPFAAENPAVERIAKSCGFASARGLGDIRSPASCGSCPFAETIPPADPYDTAAPDEVDSTWTLQNLQDLVTNAEAHGGGWVQLTFHHIAVGTEADLTISPTLFATFVSWLSARTANGTTVVQTVAQALGAVTPPAPTAPAAPTGVTAVAGNASATVKWTAPNSGGSAITSYTVTPFSGTVAGTPVQVTGAPPATSATISGLSNGTAYTFAVTATNTIGTSPRSAASPPVTPAAPPATVVLNGGFESALTSWVPAGAVVPKPAARAHSGNGSALIGLSSGRESVSVSTLSQTVTVPAVGTSTLSFWYQPHTSSRNCTATTSCTRDWMEGQIRSSTGSTLATVFKLNNNRGSWTHVTTNLTAFKGQTVTLWFNVNLSGHRSENTWMYLDDVAITTA